MSGGGLEDFSMEELFRAEAESQCQILCDGLLELEQTADHGPLLESLMRAAHSLKGAARIIGLEDAVGVAHAMEDRFVQAQRANAVPPRGVVDVLLRGVDLLRQLTGIAPGEPSPSALEEFVRDCQNPPAAPETEASSPPPTPSGVPAVRDDSGTLKRDVRLDSERLDTLLGLAGQAMVTARAGHAGLPAARSIFRQLQHLLTETLRADAAQRSALLSQALALAIRGQAAVVEEHERRDVQARRLSHLCTRIYNETLSCRQRPFGDITPGLRRLSRDLARKLGKEVSLHISGEDTVVDRDLLDHLDGPLSHLIRNSLDHGLEAPDERQRMGKPPRGDLQISARHQAGWLVIAISDDGRGPDFDAIRTAVTGRGMASPAHVEEMTETELLDFLLLPGFSLREKVTDVSGRGVGLDAVRAMAYSAGGSLRLTSLEPGLLCEIILPVSLSLVRSLIVTVGEDLFALPLTRVERVLKAAPGDIHAAAGRQHVFLEEERVEIFSAAQILDIDSTSISSADGALLVVIQGPQQKFGLAVDRLVGQRELSLQRLDSHLGRLQDVSAVALNDDGEPVVLLDINDLAVTAAHFSTGSRYRPLSQDAGSSPGTTRRVLVVDDSLTVRELERKLLASRGYAVETAVDGADAWNALRGGGYDLLVTDIDMPRLDGIELTRLVRADSHLRDLPIVIVSYKDRAEDKSRGLEAGADFYLPKSSFQDESLVNAVLELIGEPTHS